MIDFTALPVRKKTYAGANGSKIAVVYEGRQYMLKFPGHPALNKEMSYANGCVSEYLGSHIFEIVGIPVQQTLLGTYTYKGREKVVVACRDFTDNDTVLQDFASMKNTIVDSGHNGYGTELSEILETIQDQLFMDPVELNIRFWDMFIVDALIGNWDRHNGNWGFLYNSRTDEMKLAPVFDCGSSLYPQADASIMKKTLLDEAEMNLRVYEMPTSGVKLNGRKIRYYDFISSLAYKDCNEALKRIVPEIDMEKIRDLIDGTPFITDLQKDFYMTMLEKRKEIILDSSLERLRKMEATGKCR